MTDECLVVTKTVYSKCELAAHYLPAFQNREAFWDHVIQTSPHLPKGYGERARAFYASRDLNSTEANFQKGIALSPKERSLHHGLAVIYFDQERFPEAEKEFNAELEIDPQTTESLLNLGVLYYAHTAEKERAAPLWERILAVKPGDTKAHEYLAIYNYEVQKDIPAALAHTEAIIRSGGKPQRGLLEMREMYRKK